MPSTREKKSHGIGKALKKAANATGQFVGESAMVRAAGAVGSGIADAAGIVGSSAASAVSGAASGIGSAVTGGAKLVANSAAVRGVGALGTGISDAVSATGRGVGRAAGGAWDATAHAGMKTSNFFTGRMDPADLEKLSRLYGIQKEGKALQLPPAEMPPELFVASFSEEAWHSMHEFVRAACLTMPSEEKLLEWCADFFLNRMKQQNTTNEINQIAQRLRGDDDDADVLMNATEKVMETLGDDDTNKEMDGNRQSVGTKISKFL